ncbi:MAG: sugar phosphate isomerase/epimerase [Pseudopedobacter saltans]|uniref:Sugar phosphate isomerase/epimerase n=1 Tax=Pseudopedobacter saltans TaxID=151895 RepID=A0A2W5ESF7_9SPHI|nr:MAG: sugar phosphate isomerase/epimerase [Pseudopedobacter saltans]
MNPKFGASILSYMLPKWNDADGITTIQKTAAAGFDLIEILLPPSLDIDTSKTLNALRKNNIDIVCSMNLPPFAHIPFHPKEAISLLTKTLDVTEALGSQLLCGVLHSGIGVFSGDILQETEKNTIVEAWQEVADYAKTKGIDIAVEPINRYESYVCNTAKNVSDLIAKTGKDNIYLHLDTFHMNIEESNFSEPILSYGQQLKHIHMTESDRGMLGEGNVHWDDLFAALQKINYTGNLVLENFSSSIKGMQQAVSLWQKSPYNAEDLAYGSLRFMKQMVEKYNTKC